MKDFIANTIVGNGCLLNDHWFDRRYESFCNRLSLALIVPSTTPLRTLGGLEIAQNL